MATEVLSRISTDADMRARLHSQKMYRMDREHEKACARKDGLAEGLAEGRAKGLAEGHAEGKKEGLAKGREEERRTLARHLLNDHIPLEKVAEYTQLSIAALEKIRAEHRGA